MSCIHWIDGKGCLRAGGGTNSPTGAFLIWDVQVHVTPPSRQPRRAGISTVADMLQAAASVFGGKGNNSSVTAYLEVEP